MAWQELLAEAGVTVTVADSEHLLLIDEAEPRRLLKVRLLSSKKAMYPSRIPPLLSGEQGLIIVPHATPAVVDAARRQGWNVVSEDGTIDLRLSSRHLRRRHHPTASTKASRGRPARTKFVITRVLLAQDRGLPQRELAEMAGVSQPSVSRACKELHEQGLIALGRAQVEAVDWFGLAHWWLANYQGPGGTTSYWFGLEPPIEQVAKVAEALPDAVFSGSAAADLLAPWQRPDFTLAYTRTAALLEDSGFVAVSDPAAATLEVRAPADQSMWSPHPIQRSVEGSRINIADPLQVVRDLLLGPESGTRSEAAERLLHRLHGPLRASWANAWTKDPHE